jgi:hypothetical protein
MADAQLEHGLYTYASTYLPWHALVAVDAGESIAAHAERVALAAAHTAPDDIVSVGLVSAAQALLAADAGDDEQAALLAERAVKVVDRGDQTWNRADVRRWVADVVQAERRRQLLVESRDLYAEKGLLFWQRRVEQQLAGQ